MESDFLRERDAAFGAAVSTVPDATGAEMAFVGVPDGTDSIVLAHSVHAATRALDGVRIPSGWGLGGKVLASCRPHWVSDYPNADNITHLPQVDASVATEGLHAILGVPIVFDDRFLGVLYAGHHDVTSFGDRQIDAMIESARRTAAAIVFAEQACQRAHRAVEEERRRIASQLNNEVSARLAAIGAGAHGIAGEAGLDPRIRLRLANLEHQAAEASATLRLTLRALNTPLPAPRRPPFHGLSPREYDVLRRVALGERNSEIAAAINLSRNTVKSYLQSASEKLGARNRVEAVARAAEAGLL